MTTSGPIYLALSTATTFLTLTFLPGVTYQCPTSGHGTVHLMTFNADLTPSVSQFETRRSRMANKSLDYDFMCLQGVWYEQDMQNIVEKFKIHYSPIHSSIGDLGSDEEKRLCTVETFDQLVRRYGLYCGTTTSPLECMADKGLFSMVSLPEDCQACFGVSLHPRSKNVQGDLSRCRQKKRNNRINRSGLLVLAKENGTVREITSSYHRYHEDTNLLFERGYLQGNITTKTGKTLEYVCTHLTGYAPDFYEKRIMPHMTYKEIQANEIDGLLAKLSSRNVVLGSLNTGPDSGKAARYNTAKAFWPDNYNKFQGYQNPFVRTDGRCTYCTFSNNVLDETLIEQDITWTADENIFDHILIRNVTAIEDTAQRTMEDDVSDHYGVELKVSL